MIKEFIQEMLREDVGRGDLYALVSKATPSRAKVIAKSSGILAGEIYINVLAEVENFNVVWHLHDSDSFKVGDVLVELEGDSHTLLKIERTLLNILHHASSIATLSHQFVVITEPYGTKMLDTRKTRPLLRVFEKYATRTGGAVNHRMGLDDCLMLKDTHLSTIDDLELFMKNARQKIPFTSKIEIEAESFSMAQRAMQVGADIVMCDNMTPEEVRQVVNYRNENFKHILIEASGNISLDTLESYAQSGVDALSSGAMIHQSKWIDLSMKMA